MKVYRDSLLKNGIILVVTVTAWGVVPRYLFYFLCHVARRKTDMFPRNRICAESLKLVNVLGAKNDGR